MMTRCLLMLLVLIAGRSLAAQEAASEASNVFLYGINLSTQYDEGKYFTRSSAIPHAVVYTIQPSMAFRMARPRWETTIRYLPGFTYSTQPNSNYDLVSQSFGLLATRRLTKRLTFQAHNNFTLTSNPFDALRANSELTQVPILDRANTTLSATTRSRRMEQAVASVSYALDARSTVGIAGNFMHLTDRHAATSLLDASETSISEAGSLFYNRQVGPRSSTGFRYTYQKIDFDHGSVTTHVQSLVYVVNIAITPALSVYGFAGPAYSDTRNRPANNAPGDSLRSIQWTPVGGATLAWTNPRTSLSAGFVRQVTDGGGSRSTVSLDSYSAETNRKISRRLGVTGFIVYNTNHVLLPVPGSSTTFDYLAAGGGLERQISENCSFGFFYWRVQQNDPSASEKLASGNRVGIRISYSKQKPIGRP